MKPVYYIRVLPHGSDAWVTFDKYTSIIPVKLAIPLLKGSERFKGVEYLTSSQLRAEGGVDALILAEVQIAGGWPPQEQEIVRSAVTIDAFQRPDSMAKREQLEWVEDQFAELINILGVMLDADPSLYPIAEKVFPKRFLNGIRRGERDVRPLLMPERKGLVMAIRWPAAGGEHYKDLAKQAQEETGMSFSSFLCVLLELWDGAPAPAKAAAVQRAKEKGLRVRKHTVEEVTL